MNATNRNLIPEALIKQGIEIKEVFKELDLESVERFKPNLLISDRSNFLFRKNFLEKQKYPMVNIHPSMLPYHKGAHPIFWSLITNSKWAVTMHEILPGIDNGPIVIQKEVDYSEEISFREAYDIYRKCAFELVMQLVQIICENTYSPIKQADIALSNHKIRNVQPLIDGLSKGYDTSVLNARLELESKIGKWLYPVV